MSVYPYLEQACQLPKPVEVMYSIRSILNMTCGILLGPQISLQRNRDIYIRHSMEWHQGYMDFSITLQLAL